MNLPIFSIVIIFIAFIAFVKAMGNLKVTFAFFLSLAIISNIFLDVGYFIKINEFYVEYNYFFSFLAFVFALFYFVFAQKINRNTFFVLLSLIGFVAISYVLKFVYGASYLSASYDGTPWDTVISDGTMDLIVPRMNYKYFLRMIMLCFIIFAASKLSKKFFYKTSNIVYKISLVYLGYLLVEFVLLNVFNSNVLRGFSFRLFGESLYSLYTPRRFMFFWAPLGFAREPSDLSLSLWFIAINAIFYHKRRYNKCLSISLLLSMFFMITSSSFGGIMHFMSVIVLIFILNIRRMKTSVIVGIFLVSVTAIVAFLSIYATRFNIFFSYLASFNPDSVKQLPMESTIIRMYSIYNNLVYLARYPLTGTGLGTIYSFSAIITLLANLGLVGFVLFVVFYSRNAMFICHKKIRFIYYIPLIITLLFTGHVGYILFYEKTFFILVIITMMFPLQKKKKKVVKHEEHNLCSLPVTNC